MRAAILICVALASCASQPLTPEQRAALLQYSAEQQRLNAQQNDAWYREQMRAAQQNRPIIIRQQPAAPVIQPPVRCTTQPGLGGVIETTCY